MKMKKRFLCILLSLVMVLGLVPGMSLTAYAAGVSYVDGRGTSQTVEATELEAATTNWIDGSWYIVPEGGLTISGRIAVGGTVNLILRDGAALTSSAGIRTTGATLNIYAQSAGTGALTATGNNGGRLQGGNAGIGGNGVEGYESGGAGGTVNIYGGTVMATGGNGGDYAGGGAGIGGGGLGWKSNAGSGAGGTVNIYGGTVMATGGNKGTSGRDNTDGSGIGGGGNGYDTSTPANGTLTLGKGVKLYNGTDNTGTVLDDSDSESRSYSGSRVKTMFAELTLTHEHNFNYSADGATITATCGGSGTCDITEGLTLTISAPTGNLVYDGTTTYPAALSNGYNTTAFPGTYSISYTKDGSAYSGVPKDAGTYTASVTVGTGDAAKTASVSYTIVKAVATVTKAPTAKTLTDTGSAQELVTAGTASGGTMQYALGDANGATEPYTTFIPAKTNAGT